MTFPSDPQVRRRRNRPVALRALVAERGVLSGLPEELRRRERRRPRRPDRASGSAGLSAAARSRRLVAQPVLPLARRGRRVRRCEPDATSTRYSARLPTSTRWLPPRTHGGSESPSTSSPTISPTSTPGSRKRSPPSPARRAGAIHLPRRAGREASPSEQLAVSVRRTGLDSRPGRSVVPALVRG